MRNIRGNKLAVVYGLLVALLGRASARLGSLHPDSNAKQPGSWLAAEMKQLAQVLALDGGRRRLAAVAEVAEEKVEVKKKAGKDKKKDCEKAEKEFKKMANRVDELEDELEDCDCDDAISSTIANLTNQLGEHEDGEMAGYISNMMLAPGNYTAEEIDEMVEVHSSMETQGEEHVDKAMKGYSEHVDEIDEEDPMEELAANITTPGKELGDKIKKPKSVGKGIVDEHEVKDPMEEEAAKFDAEMDKKAAEAKDKSPSEENSTEKQGRKKGVSEKAKHLEERVVNFLEDDHPDLLLELQAKERAFKAAKQDLKLVVTEIVEKVGADRGKMAEMQVIHDIMAEAEIAADSPIGDLRNSSSPSSADKDAHGDEANHRILPEYTSLNQLAEDLAGLFGLNVGGGDDY